MIVLMGLSYGTRMPEDPGDTNSDIARIIAEVRHTVDYVQVQIEIGVALQKIGAEPNFVVARHRNPSAYLNTRENIEQMFEDLVAQGIDLEKIEIWTVSHNIHTSGIKAILKELGLPPTKQLRTKVYDRDSYQSWTRGPVVGWLYKIKAGISYVLSGQVSFLTQTLPPTLVSFVVPPMTPLDYAIYLFRHNQEGARRSLTLMQEELAQKRLSFGRRRLRKAIADCEARLELYRLAIQDLEQGNPDGAIRVLEDVIPQIQESSMQRAMRIARAPGTLTGLSRSPVILGEQIQQLRELLVHLRK